ncbi:hypothetical protein [uncultured Clostridium sp.]|uniref:hypothetical protein n=1 Tax=uncultured Clostridium sp. TaxID=59620 RepID=UPI00280AEC2B|nr:hypothetical protein [uncultured Clostridium sp.]
MDKIKEEIRNYITKGIIKTEGIRKLKKQFNINEKELSIMWLEEKENIKGRNVNIKTRKLYREDVIQRAIKKNGLDMQLTVALEELAELQQAICKYKRGEEHNVEEEIADVKIMIEQLETIFNKDKIRRWRNKKIERLDRKLKA